MSPDRFRFDCFELDSGDRQLRRDGEPVELNARYLDALSLLVSEPGRLVSKDRFLDEVWRGVPVTDEALTQCIRTLRKRLGDDASRPRFIETVPKHGYRFIAPVERDLGAGAVAVREVDREAPSRVPPVRRFLLLGLAGTAGGGAAGLLGGLFYGFSVAAVPPQGGIGALSILLVLTCITVLVGLIGGAGVSFGIAASELSGGRGSLWSIIGGAAGGLIVGAIVKLIGLDTFNLLFGRSPGDVTGAAEGVLLGGAAGLGAWLGGSGGRLLPLRSGISAAAGCGAVAGIFIVLLGGRLMGGSLDLLSRQLPNSQLRVDQIGALFGEQGFGTISRIATAGLEGALFVGLLVGAMAIARRTLDARKPHRVSPEKR